MSRDALSDQRCWPKWACPSPPVEQVGKRSTKKHRETTICQQVKHMSSFLQDYPGFLPPPECIQIQHLGLGSTLVSCVKNRFCTQDHTRYPDSMHRDIVVVKLSSHLWHCFNSVLRLWDIHHQRQFSYGSLRRRDAMNCKPLGCQWHAQRKRCPG